MAKKSPLLKFIFRCVLVLLSLVALVAVANLGYVFWYYGQVGIDQRVAPQLALPTGALVESPWTLEPVLLAGAALKLCKLNVDPSGNLLASLQAGQILQLPDLDDPTGEAKVILDVSARTFDEEKAAFLMLRTILTLLYRCRRLSEGLRFLYSF